MRQFLAKRTQSRQQNKLRDLIVGVDEKIPLEDGRFIKGINFDNAATTPPFKSVLTAIEQFAPWYSSVGRGKGYKSTRSAEIIERTRINVLSFVGGKENQHEVVFTKNCTESIHLLSHIRHQTTDKRIILVSEMEHISNDLPWRTHFEVEYIAVNEDGQVSLQNLQAKLAALQGQVALVSITGASNVTGSINPIYEAAELTHRYGAKIHIDAAQFVPHETIEMIRLNPAENIDFLSFTGHKLYAPFGTAVLIGGKDDFREAEPMLKGGGTVQIALKSFVQWNVAPERFEGGTPNVMGIVALNTAIRTLQQLNLETIKEYEQQIMSYTLDKLRTIDGLRLFHALDDNLPQVSVLSFAMNGLHHQDIAHILAGEFGISVRAGFFCAYSCVQKLLQLSDERMDQIRNDPGIPSPGLVRISLSFYNTFAEVDQLAGALQQITSRKEYYAKKYEDVPKGICGRPRTDE
ncbi:aminotransferase class V-fold PLP-dependent enzyme [Paenibacillus glycanilyticus]|uniref:aminotransferase class V-fold PLP-dependent enzyme n=1 Tax=Paenibacillus glycanilyticus TaxID=126569 RepID=UPI00203CE1D3|nr:aminotransferase class V-fold PLP-dependent enzyme [Paenibacillus glycanilyticus]MCM3627730.1 aminotransferase class V-fold PLP-dependent enzyme [Paenibacillus glycanilyticus]